MKVWMLELREASSKEETVWFIDIRDEGPAAFDVYVSKESNANRPVGDEVGFVLSTSVKQDHILQSPSLFSCKFGNTKRETCTDFGSGATTTISDGLCDL